MSFPTVRKKCAYPDCPNKAMQDGRGGFKKLCTKHHRQRYGYHTTDNAKDKLRKKKKHKCGRCGILADTEIHRIKHGQQGGKYNKSNAIELCDPCHKWVHRMERLHPQATAVWRLELLEKRTFI